MASCDKKWIKVIFKVSPNDSRVKGSKVQLLKAHWKTACMASGAKPEILLVRSGLHDSTIVQYGPNNEPVYQDDEPHVTASWKVKEKDNHFFTAHGYTRGTRNFDVRNVDGGDREIPLKGKHNRRTSSWIEDEAKTELFTEEYLDELVGG